MWVSDGKNFLLNAIKFQSKYWWNIHVNFLNIFTIVTVKQIFNLYHRYIYTRFSFFFYIIHRITVCEWITRINTKVSITKMVIPFLFTHTLNLYFFFFSAIKIEFFSNFFVFAKKNANQIRNRTEKLFSRSFKIFFFFVISAMYRFSDSFGCDLHTYKPKVV